MAYPFGRGVNQFFNASLSQHGEGIRQALTSVSFWEDFAGTAGTMWAGGVLTKTTGSVRVATASNAAKGVTYSDDLVKAAEKLYPKKIGKFEKHHPFPKYMGGAEKQKLIELPAPYHQQITNEFFKYWPKKLPGQPRVYPTAQQAQEIMQKVYCKFPLPSN